jgi:hypothetical protein
LTSKHSYPRPYFRPVPHTYRPKLKPEPCKPKAVAFKSGKPVHGKAKTGDRGCGRRKAQEQEGESRLMKDENGYKVP